MSKHYIITNSRYLFTLIISALFFSNTYSATRNISVYNIDCNETTLCLPIAFSKYLINYPEKQIYINDNLYTFDPILENNICNPGNIIIKFKNIFLDGSPTTLKSSLQFINNSTITNNHSFTFYTIQQLINYLNISVPVGTWGFELEETTNYYTITLENVDLTNNIINLTFMNRISEFTEIIDGEIQNKFKFNVPAGCKKITIFIKGGLAYEWYYQCPDCGGTNCQDENLIINGDFESEFTNWTSDYKPYSGAYNTANTYELIPSTSINCSLQTQTTGTVFHRYPGDDNLKTLAQTFNVEPNTDYDFVSYVYYENTEERYLSLKIEANGDRYILSPSLFQECPSENGNWYKYYMRWNSGSNTSINMEIRMLSAVENDEYYIDDISFKKVIPCPTPCRGPNLLVNGNFENNLNSWQSDMFEHTESCGGCNGWYTFHEQTWCSTPDHSDVGTYLMTASPLDDTTLRMLYQTVAIIPNTQYEFGGWVMNYNQNPPIIKVVINGVPEYRYVMPDGNCTGWTHFSFVWNSGSNSSAEIAIYDTKGTIYGNDFALDDITFEQIIPCPTESCITIDKLACQNLYFRDNNMKVCVPIIYKGDIAGISDPTTNLEFCLTYNLDHLNPLNFIPQNGNNLTVALDNSTAGSICFTVNINEFDPSNYADGQLTLGCMEFNVDELSFNLGSSANYDFDIPDGCENIIKVINAWLTETNQYWETESGDFWQFER